jgi:hypothetical protein
MLLEPGDPKPFFRGGPIVKFENLNGMLYKVVTTTDPETGVSTTTAGWVPGAILGQWRQLVASMDPLARRKKEGVRFLVRDASELVDKLRAATNSLGILIYPGVATHGEGKVVEDGTLADVNMVVIAQSVEDGSMLGFGGYGQGADGQDKAGGKAMTYAAKAILIQAAQLGGSKTAKALGVHDTDDTDTAIKGGVKPKKPAVSLTAIQAQLKEVQTEDDYKELRPTLVALTPEDQQYLTADIIAAKTRAGMPLPTPKVK